MVRRSLLGSLLTAVFLLSLQAMHARAQQPTDASVQSSPTTPPKPAPVDDAAAQSSPVSEPHARAAGFAVRTALPIQLSEAVDSGHLTNGQTVAATLAAAVKLSSGRTLPAGTKAKLTVVATDAAGKVNAVGEMSLQLVSVGTIGVFTDTLTYRGRPGPKDQPDSSPALGTDAGLARGARLTFHIQPQPTMAAGPPPRQGTPDGSVNGVSSGEKPPKPAAPPQ